MQNNKEKLKKPSLRQDWEEQNNLESGIKKAPNSKLQILNKFKIYPVKCPLGNFCSAKII